MSATTKSKLIAFCKFGELDAVKDTLDVLLVEHAAVAAAVTSRGPPGSSSPCTTSNPLDYFDEGMHTPLTAAAEAGSAAVVQLLLEYGADPDLQTPFGLSALMIASERGHTDAVVALAAGGARLDLANRMEHTALTIAVVRRATGAVSALACAGADLNVVTQDGLTPLAQAAWSADAATVDILVGAGAAVHVDGAKAPLPLAARTGQQPIVDALLRAGADVNSADDEGSALLHALRASGELALYLIGRGADVNADSAPCAMPLLSASASCAQGPTLLRALVAAGAEVDAVDADGVSAVVRSAWAPAPLDLHTLLACGADATLPASRESGSFFRVIQPGLSALQHAAAWNECPRTVELLTERALDSELDWNPRFSL